MAPLGRPNSYTACDSCYRSKVRCEGGSPCRKCSSTGQDCTFSRPQKDAIKPGVPKHGSETLVTRTAGRLQLKDNGVFQEERGAHEGDAPTSDPQLNSLEGPGSVVDRGLMAMETIIDTNTPFPCPDLFPLNMAASSDLSPAERPGLLERSSPATENHVDIWSWNGTGMHDQSPMLSQSRPFQPSNLLGSTFDSQARIWLQNFCNYPR